MLRLRRCILSHLLSPSPLSTPSVSPLFPLHRLLSATPIPFAAEDYLVANCGLTPAQALKASKKLSHLNSPSKPDAVLAFLTGLGLSRADVATVVSNDPQFLCADVEKTLAPRVVELSNLGLSRAEMARLVLTVQIPFRTASLHRKLEFWLSVFGSLDELLKVLKINNSLLGVHLEKVAKPNLELLQQCGISISDVPDWSLCRMIARSTKHLQEALARAYDFGIEQSSWVFIHALARFAILSREKLNKKIQLFEKLGWSRDDISSAVRRSPDILCMTEKRVQRSLEFLMGDVRLEIPYIAQRPKLMTLSIENRLLPRHCLTNFLKARGLPITQLSFYSIALMSKEKFFCKFVFPYEKSVPGLAAAYASGMFRHAQLAVAFLSEEKIAAKVEFLKKTFRWSDAEVGIVVSKLPLVLKHSKDRLRRMSEFLIIRVGLEPEYIAHRPALLTYSLERRLMPRHYVVKFLKENGLLEHGRSYYTAVQVSENVFMEKFIRPFMEAAPSLDQDYAAACRGEVPARFRFQEQSTDLANA